MIRVKKFYLSSPCNSPFLGHRRSQEILDCYTRRRSSSLTGLVTANRDICSIVIRSRRIREVVDKNQSLWHTVFVDGISWGTVAIAIEAEIEHLGFVVPAQRLGSNESRVVCRTNSPLAELSLVCWGRGEWLSATISEYKLKRMKVAHIIVCILSTQMVQRVTKVVHCHVEVIVNSPQTGSERIAQGTETST